MKYTLITTNRFDKDLILCANRGWNMSEIKTAIDILLDTGTLPYDIYRPHKLQGKLRGKWGCHIGGLKSDWVMVYDKNDKDLTMLMLRTGTHSDVF